MMNSFNEKDFLKVPVVLMGGPLDGQKYALPRLPPKLEVPIRLSVPLKQPAANAPFASYGRAAEDEPMSGVYVFLFEECVGPNGEKVLYAPQLPKSSGVTQMPEVVSTPVGTALADVREPQMSDTRP
ncbi:unannotated protein [freshwater metagenome]|uniref:Unannotated protein n=1 Tax=freshwater metagenome TaxID=449393 RepID=A0A6J7HUJ5_9ZZZZ